MKYKIEKGIPIPSKKQGAVRDPMSLSGQIRSLKKGECILVQDKKQATVSATGRVVTKQTGQKYITRSMDGGTRIWRVS